MASRTARSPSEMFLAEKTVKNYVSNLLGKLGMTHRTQAAVYAARLAERRDPQPRADTSGSRAQRHTTVGLRPLTSSLRRFVP